MSLVRKISMAALLAAAAFVGTSESFAEDKELHLGTLAPRKSPWGKVFQAWQDEMASQGKGLTLKFHYGGQQGDEEAMVSKMRSGQLAGAAITSVGLSKIYKPILALQMPGLFTSWAKLDAAREAIKADANKGFEDAGFTILGYGDVGIAHVMSKGFPVKVPDDLKGKAPYMWSADEISPKLFQVIGGVTPVPLSVTEVLPKLNAGAVNVVNAPALAAEQLQWAPNLDHINVRPSGFAIGALVVKKSALDGLSEDQKRALMSTGAAAAGVLTSEIRGKDASAFGRLKKKMTAVEPSAEDVAKWQDVFKRTREELKRGVFSPDLVARLEGMAG
jgi:TRAP-type C4-dicarboxylate transport system substrate-binding protein